ncbi:hypothetical protein LTR36_002113 [Oleoguttula mirabilis]|uniref:Uncharacterized protein n=1 Tax=Oleoguttula mirabilis TaxID=1507867 RepID=A0AAV9JLR3_9PEZI|nr:hypothetical protein LTR36_002113 [Oleoguttula mirabilis]
MDASPLKKLSAELRNRIYEFVFWRPKHRNTYISTSPSSRTGTKGQPHAYRWSPDLALTTTCRQLRTETLAIFYALTPFTFDGGNFTDNGGEWLKRFTQWLDMIGASNAITLKRLCLWLGSYNAVSGRAYEYDIAHFETDWRRLRSLITTLGLPADSVQAGSGICYSGYGTRIEHRLHLCNVEAAVSSIDQDVAEKKALIKARSPLGPGYSIRPAEELSSLDTWHSWVLALVRT